MLVKNILLIGFCIFFVSHIEAQQSRWKIKAHFDVHTNGLEGENEFGSLSSVDSRLYVKQSRILSPGLSIGALAEFQLSNRWSLYTGLSYTLGNEKYQELFLLPATENNSYLYSHHTASTNRHELSIPLSWRFYFGKEDSNIRPFIDAGIEGGYALRWSKLIEFGTIDGESVQLGELQYTSGDGSYPAEKENRFRWSANTGVGATIGRYDIGLRVDSRITPYEKHQRFYFDSSGNHLISKISLRAAYKF